MVDEYKNIQLQGKTVFAKAVFSNFRRIPKYFTADESCFMFVSKGLFSLRTPDKVIEFRQGDGMLAKCGNYFVEQPRQPEHDSLVVIAAYFHPAIVKSFFPLELSLSNFKPNFDASNFPMDDLLRIFMESIDFLIENPQVCTDDLVVIKLKELLLLLAKTDQAPSVQQFIASLFAPYEYDFREIILRNIDSNLSLPELATLCNMSLATFKRRFATVFGESPIRYLTKGKLSKATGLLVSDKGLRISDIVYDCGFETVTHFNKVFKKHYGQSPTEFRLSQKGKAMSH